MRDGANEERRAAAEAKMRKVPQYDEVSDGFEKLMNGVIAKVGEAHGARSAMLLT